MAGNGAGRYIPGSVVEKQYSIDMCHQLQILTRCTMYVHVLRLWRRVNKYHSHSKDIINTTQSLFISPLITSWAYVINAAHTSLFIYSLLLKAHDRILTHPGTLVYPGGGGGNIQLRNSTLFLVWPGHVGMVCRTWWADTWLYLHNIQLYTWSQGRAWP